MNRFASLKNTLQLIFNYAYLLKVLDSLHEESKSRLRSAMLKTAS
jgi:hypothetical protein